MSIFAYISILCLVITGVFIYCGIHTAPPEGQTFCLVGTLVFLLAAVALAVGALIDDRNRQRQHPSRK